MKRIMPALAAALAAAVLPAAQPGTATLTVSGYKNSTTLTDFPVLVRVPSSISLLCGPDGSAMRFYAADGVTELAHEIDTWNYGGDSCVWVKLPALAAGTTFQMSYGGAYGARATTDADVWTGYAGVWHLSEDGVNPPIIDSTQNGMNGLARAANGSGLAAGRIGRARLTAGGRDHAYGIVVDATNGIPQRAVADSLGTDFTASFWMNPQGNGVGDFSFGFLIDRRKGEYNNILRAVGSFDALIDKSGKAYEDSFIEYLASQEAKEEKLLENQALFKTPIVRNGKQATVGYKPDIWKTWE